MTQYAFKLTVTRVFQGGYAEAFSAALKYADEELNADDGAHVLVEDTGDSVIGDATGVFCEGCEGCAFPGIRWPAAANCDESREWVERCDNCQRFESDEDAMNWLRDTYGDNVTEYGFATPVGSTSLTPYLHTA